MRSSWFLLLSFLFQISGSYGQNTTYRPAQWKAGQVFSIDSSQFLIDGKPLQIISGELHYARIPKEYWKHRIQMAKAMGCNTIASYVFWNYHETAEGQFDFESENRSLSDFIQLVQNEGLYFLFRPGPYSCGEWDLGGIPPYLLRYSDIQFRCSDASYLTAVNRYIQAISPVIRPHQITNGGNILMLQIENEYGSYGNDRSYLETLESLWRANGIEVPFYTADGPTTFMLEAGTLKGAIVGLDAGASEADFILARKMNPGVPVFSSETYPGWLTHWGEPWQRPDTSGLMNQVRFMMEKGYSFNFYVLHGGTNFGFTAGANSGGKGYQADVTSYDYDAPIDEQGRPTFKYFALRNILLKDAPKKVKTAPIPASIPTIDIPKIELKPYASIWENLPPSFSILQPKSFEELGQTEGFGVYQTKLIGHKGGHLLLDELHDYATVFLDGNFIGTLDRSKGEKSIELPTSKAPEPLLQIFVEAMGHINFGSEIIDRKGITKKVTLNGMTLMNWDFYSLPFSVDFIQNLIPNSETKRPGVFYRGEFSLTNPHDTYIDLSSYQKGMVWVNGHNLGRYWEIGPQTKLYCPASFLKKGKNEIIVFDLLEIQAHPTEGSSNPK